MRSISEIDLVVVIPILVRELARKESKLTALETRADELSDEEIDDKCDLQEYIARLDSVNSRLKQQYLNAISEKINLPEYESLIAGAN
jgi:hypothetical protein